MYIRKNWRSKGTDISEYEFCSTLTAGNQSTCRLFWLQSRLLSLADKPDEYSLLLEILCSNLFKNRFTFYLYTARPNLLARSADNSRQILQQTAALGTSDDIGFPCITYICIYLSIFLSIYLLFTYLWILRIGDRLSSSYLNFLNMYVFTKLYNLFSYISIYLSISLPFYLSNYLTDVMQKGNHQVSSKSINKDKFTTFFLQGVQYSVPGQSI